MSGDKVGGNLPRGVRVSTGLAGANEALDLAVSASEKEKAFDETLDSTGPADSGGVAVMTLGNMISIL